MNWREKRRKKELKQFHPSIRDKLAEAERIAKGEKIVDGGVDRTPGRFYVQCEAITQKGERCKFWTTSFSHLCSRHRNK